MKYMCFVTPECRESALNHGLESEITNLKEKIEKDFSVQTWDQFPPPYIKKSLGRSYRLIASQHFFENEEIVFISFLLCIPRGSKDYDRFSQDPDSVCLSIIPSKSDMKKYISDNREEIKSELIKPDESERNFLFETKDNARGTSDDFFIYESEEWVESISSDKFRDETTRIFDLVYELTSDQNIRINNCSYKNIKSDIVILFNWVNKHRILFLQGIILQGEDNIKESLQKKYVDIEHWDIDKTLKHAYRSYPYYILSDEKKWKAIEKNKVGNIALSPEESLILDNIMEGSGEKLFPLFLNGRPGSGKSTMLHYLFSFYLGKYINNYADSSISSPPIYLTYSENLLKEAKRSVNEIMSHNEDHEINQSNEIIEKYINISFGVFNEFLLNLLSDDARRRFHKEKKVNYSDFRRMWEEKRTKNPSPRLRELSAELCWHVIRTYIKGMKYDDTSDFDVESYSDLPQKQKTVSIEIFKLVYDLVWKRWYEKLTTQNGYWDDQDLVYTVLNQKQNTFCKYPAVFCDEAQDFSKLELDFILRLSLYSQRSLFGVELKRVAFAFAGDPFQTLNPTGFDWESLQANFHEKIVTGLLRGRKEGKERLEFNYQEMSYSYRSSKQIVGFCNFIQLLRGIIFNKKGLKPQNTWFDKDTSMPVFFDILDPICEEKLREQAELVIILPCQESEEDSYVENDDFLSKLANSENSISNFLSPMRAKGLEFNRVVLYKFGSELGNNYSEILEPLTTGLCHNNEDNSTLQYKYFLNRLYVASSRAKTRLIIVDDTDGIRTLWNNDILKSYDRLIDKYPKSEELGWNSEVVNYVHGGTAESWTQDRDKPKHLADKFYQSGISENDPYFLRLATLNYRKLGLEAKAKESEAKRFEIEKKFNRAADKYVEIGDYVKALECFWKERNWRRISEESNFYKYPEQRIAHFMHEGESIAETVKFLNFISNNFSNLKQLKNLNDSDFKLIFDTCLERLSDVTDEKTAQNINEILSVLDDFDADYSNYSERARIAFISNNFKQAVFFWDKCENKPSEQDYFYAKSVSTNYPANIHWLYKLRDFKEINLQWKNNINIPLGKEEKAVLFDSLIKDQNIELQYKYLTKYPDEEKTIIAFKQFDDLHITISEDIYVEIGKIYINILFQAGKWKELEKLFEKRYQNERPTKEFSRVLTILILEYDEFEKLNIEYKNSATRILKKLFINDKWKKYVPMQVAGAAIERTGRYIECLQFYENVWKKNKISANKAEIDYSIERWVRLKLNHVNSKQNVDGRRDLQKSIREVQQIAFEKLSIKAEDIPQNPNFKELLQKMKEKEKHQTIVDYDKDKLRAAISLKKDKWANEKIAKMLSIPIDIVINAELTLNQLE